VEHQLSAGWGRPIRKTSCRLGAFVQGLGFTVGIRSISWMPTARRAQRPHVWLDGLGDWSWPGQGGAVAEVLPPPWVPALPPRPRPAATAQPATPATWQRERARLLLIGVLLSALASVCVALALRGQLGLERVAQLWGSRGSAPVVRTVSGGSPLQALPTLTPVSEDGAGSSIDTASYSSAALSGATGSFLVYLPPGYATTTQRYPVLYLLTGNTQSDSAFLQIGIQGELDYLIAHHAIPPLIAVMIQGGPGGNNWRNAGPLRYESYVLEVQRMIDRMLPTIPARDARAIAGDSMGGYGAMKVAVSNPYRFGVVESWIGFFNGLEAQARADGPVFKRLGLHAFVYGGESDHIANPEEDPWFAGVLRASGADAHSAVYPGEHSLQTVQANLAGQLVYAGRALWEMRPRGTG
jgi:enterochelin esterase-like enzyme